MAQAPLPDETFKIDRFQLNESDRPGCGGYFVGPLLMLLGLALFVLIVTFWGLHISGKMDEQKEVVFIEVGLPSVTSFELAKTGEYRISYDYDIELAGHHYATDPELPGLLGALSIVGADEPVLLGPVVGESRDEESDRQEDASRVPIWHFRTDQAGTFALDVTYRPGEDGPKRIAMVVERQMEPGSFGVASMCWVIPLAGLAALGGLIGGALLIIITRVRRGDWQRQMACQDKMEQV